jgi:hypothetical protein
MLKQVMTVTANKSSAKIHEQARGHRVTTEELNFKVKLLEAQVEAAEAQAGGGRGGDSASIATAGPTPGPAPEGAPQLETRQVAWLCII